MQGKIKGKRSTGKKMLSLRTLRELCNRNYLDEAEIKNKIRIAIMISELQ